MEAILGVRGRIEYAEAAAKSPDARESLKSALAAREWARSRARHEDPERALGAWKGLVTGRWSLVDRFESDGKRDVLARENAPDSSKLSDLSERERQVVALASSGRSNKVIAYELGLAHATVRVLLSRAASKLGARSRDEIIFKYRHTSPNDARGVALFVPGSLTAR